MAETRSPELDQLATALCAAQAEFTAIPKDSTNPFFKSRYAGLPQVVEVASPILTKHGLAVSQFIGADEHGDTLTTWLLHKSGQFLAQSMRLHLTKVDAQGQGSATTYARRYSYMAALGLVADDDDDGNRASKPVNGQSREPVAAALPNRLVAAVIEAVKRADMPPDWVRMQFIAAGAQNVPEGAVKLSTVKGLTVEQAKTIIGVCDQHTADKVAK